MQRLFLTLLALAVAWPAQAATQDDLFLAAREAFRTGQRVKLNEYAASLRGYVLASYVDYYRLRLRLDEASPGEVSDFLNRNADTLVGEQLRRDWLKVLGKRGEWELFNAAFPALVNDDPDTTCYSLQSRVRDESTVAEFARLWNTPKELPEACVAIAEAEITSGRYTTRQVWERARLLLEAGQMRAAQRTMDYLPAAETPEPKLVDLVNANPQKYLERPGPPDLKKRAHREMVIFALTRLAQKDPDLAHGYWTRKLQAGFPPADQGYVWGQIATNAAKRHMREALAWFDQAGDVPLSDEQLAWRVRAALREGRWGEVKDGIDRMTPLARSEATWLYWQARAVAALGGREDAEGLFRRVAGEYNFYGKLALEELGQSFALPERAQPSTPEQLDEASRNAGIARALALFRLDLRTDAVREWNWNLRGMDDRQLIAAAEIARRYEIWDRVINTADRTVGVHDFGLRFLAPYKAAFTEQAKSRGLEDSYVLALVRQESRFIPNARSGAGASGLMQLMPATAKWIAGKTGMKDFRWSNVTDPDTNIALGTSYLKFVMEELDGSPVLAAAAYNAGPGRARRWKADRPLEGAIYAESIPFNETRDYVKKVMSNTMYYAAVYGGEARSLKARLGTIPPRKGGEGVAGTITGETTVQ